MRSPSLVPTDKPYSLDDFRLGAGLEPDSGGQSLLCSQCVLSGDMTPSAVIVVLDGNSLCTQHLPGMVD